MTRNWFQSTNARIAGAFAMALLTQLGEVAIVEAEDDDEWFPESSVDALVAAGRIYPAYESAQELDLKRKIQLGRGLPPVYDRAALALTDEDRAKLEGEGVRPHWRFKLDHGAAIAWDDAVRGPQRFDPATMSDPVIRRADGTWLYMLPSVIDDIDMGVTQVVRGEDHVGLQVAKFLHHLPTASAHDGRLAVFEDFPADQPPATPLQLHERRDLRLEGAEVMNVRPVRLE